MTYYQQQRQERVEAEASLRTQVQSDTAMVGGLAPCPVPPPMPT